MCIPGTKLIVNSKHSVDNLGMGANNGGLMCWLDERPDHSLYAGEGTGEFLPGTILEIVEPPRTSYGVCKVIFKVPKENNSNRYVSFWGPFRVKVDKV